MNNEELLEKIGKVIDAKLDEKLEPIKTDLITVKQDLTTIKADLHELTEDMTDFFHETWEKMDTTNERVTRLEEAADLTHRN